MERGSAEQIVASLAKRLRSFRKQSNPHQSQRLFVEIAKTGKTMAVHSAGRLRTNNLLCSIERGENGWILVFAMGQRRARMDLFGRIRKNCPIVEYTRMCGWIFLASQQQVWEWISGIVPADPITSIAVLIPIYLNSEGFFQLTAPSTPSPLSPAFVTSLAPPLRETQNHIASKPRPVSKSIYIFILPFCPSLLIKKYQLLFLFSRNNVFLE